jgi:putative glutamine amidotransferase
MVVIGLTRGAHAPAEDSPYAKEVRRAGGRPLWLPHSSDKAAIAAEMARVDALLLTGGGDMAAHFFNQRRHCKAKDPDEVRDGMELEAIRLARERRLPVFGICRGVQVLNVAFGGDLVQDIPSLCPKALRHSTDSGDPKLGHLIKVEPGSLLARILGTASVQVNSRHHQAPGVAGRGLNVNARSPDGLIEGLEAVDGAAILGVQFHPEDCAEEHPVFRKLFEWLVHEAQARQG